MWNFVGATRKQRRQGDPLALLQFGLLIKDLDQDNAMPGRLEAFDRSVYTYVAPPLPFIEHFGAIRKLKPKLELNRN